MVRNNFTFGISKNFFWFLIFFFSIFLYSIFPITAQTVTEIPKVGDKAPFFEYGKFSSKNLLGKKNLIMVFYRGHFWGHCQKQLVELQQHFSKLNNEDSKLIAISTDGNDEKKHTVSELGGKFLIVSDLQRNIIRSFDFKS